MTNFRSEPFLWIHLAGLAAVPLLLQVTWLGLAVGDPLPFCWLELLLLAVVGIVPALWMQWHRPFDIFSLLAVSLAPPKLTVEQQKMLSLLKTQKQRLSAAIAASVMLAVLWLLYQTAPLAAPAAAFLPQWRILGLLLAAVAFAACNLFVQVPVSVLGLLATPEKKWAETEPYSPEKIPQAFTVPGFQVGRIFPLRDTEKTNLEF
jgi:hypothetical protein